MHCNSFIHDSIHTAKSYYLLNIKDKKIKKNILVILLYSNQRKAPYISFGIVTL